MLHGYGMVVSYQLSVLDPPCTRGNVVARHEMEPLLLCCLMAPVSCVTLHPSKSALDPSKAALLARLKRLSGSSATTKDGTTLLACSALSSRVATLPLWLWHQLRSLLEGLGLQNGPTVSADETGRNPQQRIMARAVQWWVAC